MTESRLQAFSRSCDLPRSRWRLDPSAGPNGSFLYHGRDLQFGDLDILHLINQGHLDGYLVYIGGSDQHPTRLGKIMFCIWGNATRISVRMYYQAHWNPVELRWQCLWRQDPQPEQVLEEHYQFVGTGIPLATEVVIERVERPALLSRQYGSLSAQPEIRNVSSWQLKFSFEGEIYRLIEPVQVPQGSSGQYLPICQAAVDCNFNLNNEQAQLAPNIDWYDLSVLVA